MDNLTKAQCAQSPWNDIFRDNTEMTQDTIIHHNNTIMMKLKRNDMKRSINIV